MFFIIITFILYTYFKIFNNDFSKDFTNNANNNIRYNNSLNVMYPFVLCICIILIIMFYKMNKLFETPLFNVLGFLIILLSLCLLYIFIDCKLNINIYNKLNINKKINNLKSNII